MYKYQNSWYELANLRRDRRAKIFSFVDYPVDLYICFLIKNVQFRSKILKYIKLNKRIQFPDETWKDKIILSKQC